LGFFEAYNAPETVVAGLISLTLWEAVNALPPPLAGVE